MAIELFSRKAIIEKMALQRGRVLLKQLCLAALMTRPGILVGRCAPFEKRHFCDVIRGTLSTLAAFEKP
jgi:hypothetical protein